MPNISKVTQTIKGLIHKIKGRSTKEPVDVKTAASVANGSKEKFEAENKNFFKKLSVYLSVYVTGGFRKIKLKVSGMFAGESVASSGAEQLSSQSTQSVKERGRKLDQLSNNTKKLAGNAECFAENTKKIADKMQAKYENSLLGRVDLMMDTVKDGLTRCFRTKKS